MRAACCSHVEGMNEHSLLTEDEAAFEGYLDTLAAALQHRSRKQPLRDYWNLPVANPAEFVICEQTIFRMWYRQSPLCLFGMVRQVDHERSSL